MGDDRRGLWGALSDPLRGWSWRSDGPLAVALGLATVALRLAKASTSLYTVDSVLFSLGTERYDVMELRPHPPGYPIFVGIGKAFLALGAHDANAAFVLESALWSGAAVALLYGLVRCWGSRRAAIAAAVLFAVAPAFAFNGVIALSYTAEAAGMVGVALMAWLAWSRPSTARLAGLGAAWAVAVGLRPNLFLFLAPLIGLALLPYPLGLPRDWRATLRGAAATAGAALVVALAWLIPMARASGGLARVREATRLQASQVIYADAVWSRGAVALHEHWDRLVYYLHWEMGSVVPIALVLAVTGWLVRRNRAAPAEPSAWPGGVGLFLVVWLAPALVFYVFVFDGWARGPIGYVLSVLPGLYAAAVLLADHGLRRLAAAQVPPLRRALGAFALVFLLLPLPMLAGQGNRLITSEAQAHDEWTREWQQVAGAYPANETAILTWQSWAHVEWYFPEHLAWTYFPTYKVPGKTDWALVFAMQHHESEAPFIPMYLEGPGRPDHPIPSNIRTIVVFDFQLAGENGEARRLDPALNVTEAHLPDGWRLLILHPDAAHPTVESLFTAEALGQGARGKP